MAKKKAPAKKAAKTSPRKASGKDDDKIFALLGTALPLIGYVIILLANKKSPYTVFYGKQGVVLFVAWILAMVASWILAFLPMIGWFLGMALSVCVLILWVLGIVNALSGEVKDLPVIGVYAGKF